MIKSNPSNCQFITPGFKFVSLVQVNKAGMYNEMGETITLKATIRSQIPPGNLKLYKEDEAVVISNTPSPVQAEDKDVSGSLFELE